MPPIERLRRLRTAALTLFGIAMIAIVATGIVLLPTGRSEADTGDPIIAGGNTAADFVTTIHNTGGRPTCGNSSPNTGLDVCGKTAVYGNGVEQGVYGTGTYGVHGLSINGWGVWGEGAERGVYGISDGEGVVGFGNTVGVRAEGPAIALRVNGKAEFSRSGVATITGSSTTPKSSVRVSNVALTAKSFVLTTPQTNRAGVYVQAAVPNASKSFVTLYLNTAVTNSYKVAWMIVERP
jgi:hypothetical protein